MSKSYSITRNGVGGAILVNEDGSARTIVLPGGTALNTASVLTTPTGTFNTTEATDGFAGIGLTPLSGTMSATEFTDHWSTSPGFTRLGIENPILNNGSPLSYTTNGPDRILVLVHMAVSVGIPSDYIMSITDTAGLTWQGESAVIAGYSYPNDESIVMEIWWAYAPHAVSGNVVSVTENPSGIFLGSNTTEQWHGFAVKGLNGNYDYPWDANENPLSWGAMIGSFFGADTVPDAYVPFSDGPLDSVTTTRPTFTSGNASNATLSGGNLEITSTGSSNPNNYAFIDPAFQKTAGRYYFEVQYNDINGADYAAGVVYVSQIRDATIGTFLGNGTGGILVRGNGDIYNGSLAGNIGVTPANGDWIGFCVDLDNDLFWARDITQNGKWNGSATAIPMLRLGGISFTPTTGSLIQRYSNPPPSTPIIGTGPTAAPAVPFGAVSGNSSAAMTFNFGATTYAETEPSGYTDWFSVTASTHFPFNAISIGATMAITPGTGSLFASLDNWAGFTTLTQCANGGVQRDMAGLVQYKIRQTNVLPSDNEVYQGSTAAPTWTLLYDTLVQGATDPGSWESTEAPDTSNMRGYPGAFGFIGDLYATEAPDIAIFNGFERDSGVWASTEAKDIFGAYGHLPLVGHMTVSEAPDTMTAAGLGLGENGVWASTEGVDILTIIGNTPITAHMSTSEVADRFVALGAGVTHSSARRRQLIVT
jgi:hypothetical protein